MPEKLAPEPDVAWELPLAHAGLGGIAADGQYVVFGDRDDDDFQDVFRGLRADTGEPLWQVERLAVGALDYGNSPRGTPLIDGEFVYCQGAHGHLLCIRIASGEVVWEKNFRDDYPIDEELPWGYCGSPLLVDGKLIVAPGAPDASIIALDRFTGQVLWKAPGRLPSYGSLISATFGKKRQIVGHDKTTLGGWDLHTGKRLWTITPVSGGDFNVPTPLVSASEDDRRLIVVTENNGVRAFQFNQQGVALETPIAESLKLRSDMSTPVVVGSGLYCVKDFLYCLDSRDLSERWRLRDRAIGDYAAMIASEDRLMVIGKGELLLLPTTGEKKVLSRQRVFDEPQLVYSHPALVGNRMYIRGEHKLRCIRFQGP